MRPAKLIPSIVASLGLLAAVWLCLPGEADTSDGVYASCVGPGPTMGHTARGFVPGDKIKITRVRNDVVSLTPTAKANPSRTIWTGVPKEGGLIEASEDFIVETTTRGWMGFGCAVKYQRTRQ